MAFSDFISRRTQNFRNMIAASQQGFKSVPTQLAEIVRLRNGQTHLEASWYHRHALFNQEMYAGVDLSEFTGTYMKHWLHEQLNDLRWEGLVTDKLIFYTLLEQLGFPYPRVYAASCSYARKASGYPVFRDLKDLTAFLRKDIPYPFFAKPIKGGSAKGIMRADGYDADADKIICSDGTAVSVPSFIRSLEDPTGFGFLFQEAALAHELTKPICGKAVSGCRFIMIREDAGARPFKVVWKVPLLKNAVDNFVGGTSGNLLASVDPQSGRTQRAASGFGLDLKVNPHHPDTGAPIVGTQLPQWNTFIDTLIQAAECFPGFRFQHWDVGITAKGPVIYELNSSGDLYLTQLCEGRGIFNRELKDLVKRYGTTGDKGGWK